MNRMLFFLFLSVLNGFLGSITRRVEIYNYSKKNPFEYRNLNKSGF